jgi:hypothetical protein
MSDDEWLLPPSPPKQQPPEIVLPPDAIPHVLEVYGLTPSADEKLLFPGAAVTRVSPSVAVAVFASQPDGSPPAHPVLTPPPPPQPFLLSPSLAMFFSAHGP